MDSIIDRISEFIGILEFTEILQFTSSHRDSGIHRDSIINRGSVSSIKQSWVGGWVMCVWVPV